MKTPGSNFTTCAGLAALAASVLLCAYLGLAAPGVFLGGVLLLCLTAFLWARRSLRRIEIRFPGEDVCAFPGEIMSVEGTLSNRKFLPLLWLDLTFPTAKSRAAAPIDAAESTVTETFSWVMPQQTLHWRQQMSAVKRGVCAVDALQLRSGDGFGLCEQTAELRPAGAFRLIVYPKILPTEIAPILRSMRELEKAKNGFTVDKTLLNSTRPYRSGDSFKDVNWRLLARTDEVQVNVHETLAVRRVCFVPDFESYSYEEIEEHDGIRETVRRLREEDFERMLSVIASLIEGLTERDVLCCLVLPSSGCGEARILVPENASEQVMQLLTALAEIDYHGEATSLPLEEMQEALHQLGQLYLFSYNREHAYGAADPESIDPLGIIRVLTEGEEDAADDMRILKETELITR